MSETKIIGLPGGGRWVLLAGRNEGMGGFLNPPGDAEHTYSVAEYRGSRSTEAESMMSLRGALAESWVPEPVKAVARRKLAECKGEATEGWLRDVYRHFRNCYSPDGENRNASDCLIVKASPDGNGFVLGSFGKDGWMAELPPADHHLAVMYVRQFFPDHEPRTDLILDL
jgi:hypothetical protein